MAAEWLKKGKHISWASCPRRCIRVGIIGYTLDRGQDAHGTPLLLFTPRPGRKSPQGETPALRLLLGNIYQGVIGLWVQQGLSGGRLEVAQYQLVDVTQS